MILGWIFSLTIINLIILGLFLVFFQLFLKFVQIIAYSENKENNQHVNQFKKILSWIAGTHLMKTKKFIK